MKKVLIVTNSSPKFQADQADVLSEQHLDLALDPEAEPFALA